jgi:hypothetical protein
LLEATEFDSIRRMAQQIQVMLGDHIELERNNDAERIDRRARHE